MKAFFSVCGFIFLGTLLGACATTGPRGSETPAADWTAEQRYERGLLLWDSDPTAALGELQSAADMGYARAYSRLAQIFLHGEVFEVDHGQAVHWLQLAAEAGDLESRYNLGLQQYAGRGVSADKSAAAANWQIAAEGGFAPAMSNLGSLLFSGDGVAEDQTAAFRWFGLAAKAGDADGQLKLGVCYKAGFGVTPDHPAALRWFHASAAQGNATAMGYVGEYFQSGYAQPADAVEAARWYYQAAQAGNAEARSSFDLLDRQLRDAAEADSAEGLRYLGLVFLQGIDQGVDAEAGASWLQLAANQGDARACMELAHCYAEGIGVRADTDSALKYCQKAAEAGLPEALYEAGLLSYAASGFGPEAHARAYACFKAAAVAGHAVAQANVELEPYYQRAFRGDADAAGTLGCVYIQHELLRPDYEQAEHWLRTSLEQAYNLEFALRLGRLYLRGGATTTLAGKREHAPEPRRAIELLEPPASGGDTQARSELARLYADRNSGVYDLERAMHWVDLAAVSGDYSAVPVVQAAYDADQAAALASRQEFFRFFFEEPEELWDSYEDSNEPFPPSPCGFCGGSGTQLQSRGQYINGHYWPDTYTTCLECNGTGLLFH